MPFDSTPRMTPLARVSSCREHRSRPARTRLHPGVRVGRSADDLHRRAGPGIDNADAAAGRHSGCCFASRTRATTKPSYFAAGSSTRSTSSPTRVSVSTISAQRGRGLEMVFEPGEGEFHCGFAYPSPGGGFAPGAFRPRSMLATLMSSSISGQWTPSGLSSTIERCAASGLEEPWIPPQTASVPCDHPRE